MEQQGLDPAAITYAELIDKQCERSGRWQDALTLFEEMEVCPGHHLQGMRVIHVVDLTYPATLCEKHSMPYNDSPSNRFMPHDSRVQWS